MFHADKNPRPNRDTNIRRCRSIVACIYCSLEGACQQGSLRGNSCFFHHEAWHSSSPWIDFPNRMQPADRTLMRLAFGFHFIERLFSKGGFAVRLTCRVLLACVL